MNKYTFMQSLCIGSAFVFLKVFLMYLHVCCLLVLFLPTIGPVLSFRAPCAELSPEFKSVWPRASFLYGPFVVYSTHHLYQAVVKFPHPHD